MDSRQPPRQTGTDSLTSIIIVEAVSQTWGVNETEVPKLKKPC